MRPALILAIAVLLACGSLAAADRPNLLADPGFEQGAAGWDRFGQGFAIDRNVRHSGAASVRFTNTEPKQTSGVLQILTLNQTHPIPIWVAGWSKAQNVTGAVSSNYSIYCDVDYVTDTRPGRVDAPGLTINFETTPEGWQYGERLITPAAPIKWIKVYALFRNRYTGTVWFDDLHVGPISAAPITGDLAGFPALPGEAAPPGFAAALAKLPADQALVHVTAQGGRTGWIAGEQASLAGGAARRAVPWRFPRTYAPRPAAADYAGVWLRRARGQAQVDVCARSRQAGSARFAIALPRGAGVAGVAARDWEPASDDIHVYRCAGRVVLCLDAATEGDEDAMSFALREPARLRPAAPEPRPAKTARRSALRASDGLELAFADNAGLAEVRVAGRAAAGAANGGLSVGDFFAEPLHAAGGGMQQTETGLRQLAQREDMGLRIAADFAARRDRIDVEVEVRDALGVDRAIDLAFTLPVAAAGWTWWEDLDTKRIVSADKPIESSIYPWATLTSPDRRTGLTLAIPPRRPCVFSFRCDARRGLSVRFPLALTQASKTPGRARVAFSIFRTNGRWGFRDAARRYYDAFPGAFERRAMKEGGWLFACPTAKLKNPEDYAYHEGGPAGWRLDEKLGILTCPYRIPTQRQIVFPSLPQSDAEAVQWIAAKSRELTPAHWRCKGAVVVQDATANGTHSLYLHNRDGKAYVGAQQDVVLNQTAPRPIVLSARCRADGVSGKPDGAFGLWADLIYADGTRQWGRTAPFPTGSHGWVRVERTVRPAKPAQRARLHVLMRRGHAGKAWVDDVALREEGDETNRVGNPGFEDAQAHPYARMMQNCAALDRDGLPSIVRRDNVGADVLPKHPIYNVVYAVNCDADLFADDERLAVGEYELALIERMLAGNPKLDGIYLDSTSGWVSRMMNFRREHLRYVDHPLTYDPATGRPVAAGWLHTFEFMHELQRRLAAKGKLVFPNIGRGRRLPFLYFVCDVVGLEGGLRTGDWRGRLNFYRTLAYHKPVLVMDYLSVIGRPTRHAGRRGFERFWKWCALYGCHPSIGRDCVKAYEEYGDVYRKFREPLRRLGAAGWEPVTLATASNAALIERFGDAKRGLYFTVFNPTDQAKDVRVELDAQALGLRRDGVGRDLLSPRRIAAWPASVRLGPEELAIIAIESPGPGQ